MSRPTPFIIRYAEDLPAAEQESPHNREEPASARKSTPEREGTTRITAIANETTDDN